jgi:hypothetical protein
VFESHGRYHVLATGQKLIVLPRTPAEGLEGVGIRYSLNGTEADLYAVHVVVGVVLASLGQQGRRRDASIRRQRRAKRVHRTALPHEDVDVARRQEYRAE